MPAKGMPWDEAFVGGLLAPQVAAPLGLGDKRYAVYRNNVTVGLVRALEANFPVVRRLLGTEYFAGFARQFSQVHPPQSPLMFHYGSHFPVALAGETDLSAYPYLADVAHLEISWRESFHAADAPVLQADALAGLDGDTLMEVKFSPHPTLRLLHSDYAIADIFHANRETAAAATITPTQRQWVVVHRVGFDVHVEAVTFDAYTFVEALCAGNALGDAAEQAFGINPMFDLAAALALVLGGGYFQSMTQG